jgi:hypothetical protein
MILGAARTRRTRTVLLLRDNKSPFSTASPACYAGLVFNLFMSISILLGININRKGEEKGKG